MNFSKMNGYEFEDFIANLLRQKGFKVTQTDYSNDGGVDLIAEYFKPLFSGKYIVQCKNYTNNLVGQPELRDLYGVVMSEKANKGILITTSDFTTQAKNFAKDKNLELINGSVLNSLIEGVDIKVEEPQLKFYEMPEFDKKNYEFLKKRLKAGKKNEKNYDNLITLLESYILNGKVELCKAGLIDEIRNLREEKRINTNKDYVYNPNRNVIDLNKLDLCFIEGDLLLATKTLIESEDFYFSNYPSFLSFYCCLSNIYYKNDIFFNMDFYKKDPLVKRIKIPNFLASYNKNDLEEIYKQLYIEIPEYFLDEGLDNWINNISKIVDKNFSNIYSQEELKAIVEKYKHNEFSRDLYKYHSVQVSASISDWKKSDQEIISNLFFDSNKSFISSGITIEMINCKPGSFIMGSPKNELGRSDDEIQHKVTISKAFMIGKYPVTQRQYQEIMKSKPSIFTDLDNPVENVTWLDAKKFCEKLNIKFQKLLPSNYQFDLPTEAQWEYACRGETSTALNNGKDLISENNICLNLSEISWYDKNSNEMTHKVGRKKT